MWSTILKYTLLAIYTPEVCCLISDIYRQTKVPNIDFQIQKKISNHLNYCKCGVCQQNRKLGLPLKH